MTAVADRPTASAPAPGAGPAPGSPGVPPLPELIVGAGGVAASIIAAHREVRAAFIAGSLVQGYGNARSDIDLYLLCDTQPTDVDAHPQAVALAEGVIQVGALETGVGPRYDVEYWTTSQVAQCLDKVAANAFAAGTATGSDLSGFEIDLLSRLAHAVPVAGDPGLVDATVTALRSSAFFSVMAARAATHYDIRSEDVRGQLEAADLHSAVLSTRIAFGAAVETVLAAYGDCGDSEKWRARRLMASPQRLVSMDEYWAVETMRGLDVANPVPWILDVIALAQRLVGGVDFVR